MHLYNRFVTDADRPQHYSRCKCGQSSGMKDNLSEVEDWEFTHNVEVQRVLALLGPRNPSLASQARYYREMEAKTTDAKHKELWRVLAEGLEARLGTERTGEDEGLW